MEDNKIIGIALSTGTIKQLEYGNYNKSRIINWLLEQHFNTINHGK